MSGISKNFLDAYNVKIHSHCLYASPIKKKKKDPRRTRCGGIFIVLKEK